MQRYLIANIYSSKTKHIAQTPHMQIQKYTETHGWYVKTLDNSQSASYNVTSINTRLHSVIVNSYQPSQHTNSWQLTKLTTPSIWDDSSRKHVPTRWVGDTLGPVHWTAWRGVQRSEVTWSLVCRDGWRVAQPERRVVSGNSSQRSRRTGGERFRQESTPNERRSRQARFQTTDGLTTRNSTSRIPRYGSSTTDENTRRPRTV